MPRGLKVENVDGAYRTFEEETLGELDGQEFGLVILEATGRVSLRQAGKLTPIIGIYVGKLQPGATKDRRVNIRLFGKGGTIQVVQDDAIAAAAQVQPGVLGDLSRVEFTSGSNAMGLKIASSSGAQGDTIEIADGTFIG